MTGARQMLALALGWGLLALPQPALAVETGNAREGALRILDKITGEVSDLTLATGESVEIGVMTITLRECRFPAANPSGDAFALVTVTDRRQATPVFEGWMVASAPALNAMDHPRYDVWAMRCITE